MKMRSALLVAAFVVLAATAAGALSPTELDHVVRHAGPAPHAKTHAYLEGEATLDEDGDAFLLWVHMPKAQNVRLDVGSVCVDADGVWPFEAYATLGKNYGTNYSVLLPLGPSGRAWVFPRDCRVQTWLRLAGRGWLNVELWTASFPAADG